MDLIVLKRRNKDWQISEDKACSLYGGRLVPASGATAGEKLDIIIESGPLKGVRIENKYTSKNSFSISKDLIHKLDWQGAVNGGQAILRVDINGDVRIDLPENMFLNLLSRIPSDDEED